MKTQFVRGQFVHDHEFKRLGEHLLNDAGGGGNIM